MIGMKSRMIKNSVSLILFFAALAFGQTTGSITKGILVISNNGEDQAVIVDAATLRTIAALPSGKNPHDIAISPDGRFAYVAIMGTPEVPGNTLDVIDLKSRTVKKAIDLGKFTMCHDVKVSRDG